MRRQGWPAGEGEMARLIRTHDWEATPLGPAERWPQSLKTVVETLLGSGFPTIALWGPELCQLYNDGCRRIMAEKHPEALGQPTRECWPEVWHINEPIYERVLSGETLTFEDKLFPITRHGYLEDAWFTLCYSPLRDEEGSVAGVLVSAFETTEGHRTDAALEESEARYRAFVTASSDVVYRMGPDWAEMRQLDGRGFISDTAEPTERWMERYIHPDDWPLVKAAIEEAVRAKGVFELEHRVVRVDGTLGWTLSRAVPILGEGGELVEWLGTASDVTERKRTEEALRQSEEKYRTLFTSIDEGFCIIEVLFDGRGEAVDYRFLETNPAFERQTGLEKAAGKTMRELAPEHEEFWFEVYGRIARTQEAARFEHEAAALGRFYDVYAFRIGEPGENRVAIIFNDILARKRAEEALRESERKYSAAFDSMDEGFCMMELAYDEDGEIADLIFRETNKAFEKNTGLSEVVGRTVGELLPAFESYWIETYSRVARTGEAVRTENYVRDVDRWYSVHFSLVGEVGSRHVAVLFDDITERKRAEEALRESEERYRLAVEAADLGRWELVPETGEFYTSPTCNRHLGLPEDARPTHEGHFRTIHPDDHAMIYERLQRAAEVGGEFEAEYRVIHPSGGVRRILSRARMLHDPGSAPDSLTGVTLDVTEARELEEEREKTRARDLAALAEAAERERISRELHDRVAHDLGVAHQSLELFAALREAAPERAAEKLDLVRRTTRLALDQTRALSAELKRLQDEELKEGLEVAFGKLAASYVPDGVGMEVSFSGEESAISSPVGTQVYLVMREAVRNAVKHSGCSHISVTLTALDGELYGLVEDDGEGFDVEAVARATPSWGVGLRSMRERAEMLGGTLRLDAEPGQGTRVEIRVPLDGHRP